MKLTVEVSAEGSAIQINGDSAALRDLVAEIEKILVDPSRDDHFHMMAPSWSSDRTSKLSEDVWDKSCIIGMHLKVCNTSLWKKPHAG